MRCTWRAYSSRRSLKREAAVAHDAVAAGSAAEWIVSLHLSRWALLTAILLMVVAIVLLCLFPQIATALPDLLIQTRR